MCTAEHILCTFELMRATLGSGWQTWLSFRNHVKGLTAPASCVHARRLLLYSVKHHGTALIAVASLQLVRSSSLHKQHPHEHASLTLLTCSLSKSRQTLGAHKLARSWKLNVKSSAVWLSL